MSRLRVALLIALPALLLAAAGLALAPTRPTGRAALLTADLLLQTRGSPLQWLTRAPTREAVRFGDGGEGTLYRPAGPQEPRPGVILSAGFAPDLSDPLLNRLAADLARLGFVAFIPRTPALREGIMARGDVDVLTQAFEWLEAQPQLARRPIGYAGFCVGSSLAFVAAADPRIAPRVAYVYAFGGYCDAVAELRAIRTGAAIPGDPPTWRAAPRAAELFAVNVLAHAESPADAAAITAALGAGATTPPPGLTPLDDLIARVLLAEDGETFDALMARVPPAQRAELAAVSPCAVAGNIRARVFIMHDRDDPYVPAGEAGRLAAALPAETQPVVNYYTIFNHVRPDRASDVAHLAREGAALFRQLRDVLSLIDTL